MCTQKLCVLTFAYKRVLNLYHPIAAQFTVFVQTVPFSAESNLPRHGRIHYTAPLSSERHRICAFFNRKAMGSCLSCVLAPLSQPQPSPNATTSNAAAASPVANNGFAGVLGSALHTLANQFDASGGDGAQSPVSVRPDDGVKFTIERAYVFKMPDGDTISVDYMDSATSRKATTRIRIMGIDCPETAQNFGKEATDIGRAMIFQKHVTLHVHTTDRYGRMVADVYTENGVNFASEMLRKGAAWHYKAYDKRQELADLEDAARAERVGLWSFARPVQPWVYRKRKRERQNND